MINLSQTFSSRALAISAAYGGPYFDALVHSKGEAIFDDGGSIIAPGDASYRACHAQTDSATQDMRREEGFDDGDVRILVLADTLPGEISLDDTIQVLCGPHLGHWQIQTVSRDPFGIYHELRGRRA